MKCAYRLAEFSNAEHTLGYKYGLWAMEYADSAFGIVLARSYGFGGKRLQKLYDEIRESVSNEVGKYTADTVYVKDERKGRMKGCEQDVMADAREQVVFNQTKRLEAVGFSDKHLQAIVAERDTTPVFRNKRQREALRRSRWYWYMMNGEEAMQLYVGALLLYMSENHGFGKQRLEKLYSEFAPYIHKYMERFLRGDLYGDDEMRAELNAMHSELERHGIELAEMPEEDAVTVKKASQTTMPTITHEDFEKKMTELYKEIGKR